MGRTSSIGAVLVAVALAGNSALASAAPGACAGFRWNIDREHALFATAAQPLAAGRNESAAPLIRPDRLYSLALAPQQDVRFAVNPQKLALTDGDYAGLARIRIAVAGSYRVSLDAGFWIDVVSGGKVIDSRDFAGRPGCGEPRKIVLYDLPAGVLILQLSGNVRPHVRVTVTRAPQPIGVAPFIHHRDPPSFRALAPAEGERAELGHAVFNTHWVPAGTARAARRDGLGPLFNASSCDECHNEGARGRGPLGDGLAPTGLVVDLAQPSGGRGGERCDPVYGCVLNPVALKGVPPEGRVVIQYRTVVGRYPDGTRWSLRAPTYRLVDLAYGPLARRTVIEPRLAPAIFGDGLLDAVPASAILAGRTALGVPAWQWRNGVRVLGRLGWEGAAVSIRDQTARAFAREMGITSSVITKDDCTAREIDCLKQPNGGAPEVSDGLFDAVVAFESTLAVPAAPLASSAGVADQSELFAELGCADCHRPQLPVAFRGAHGSWVRAVIAPYTDLRLHDLGAGLADANAAGIKVRSLWRTAPLWGIGYRLSRESVPTFLHDGRARSLAEAVLWHGGEAAAARERFEELPVARRGALLRWLATL